MPTKITREVLESYLSCKLKGHLKLAGQDGTPCDYEGLLLGMRGVVKAKAAVRLRAGHPGERVASGVPIAPAVLGQGWQVILDGTIEDDSWSLQLDGLEQLGGLPGLGAGLLLVVRSPRRGGYTQLAWLASGPATAPVTRRESDEARQIHNSEDVSHVHTNPRRLWGRTPRSAAGPAE
ncbi:MAG TPA: hypothetical protein VKE74_14505 [Gemmataceae bacterium]|nr:hypothetical protein [Gemmataceae bacterium]